MLTLPDSTVPTGVQTLASGASRSFPDAATFDGELAVALRNRHSDDIELTVRTLGKPETDSTVTVLANSTLSLAVRQIKSVTLAGPLDIFTVKVRHLEML